MSHNFQCNYWVWDNDIDTSRTATTVVVMCDAFYLHTPYLMNFCISAYKTCPVYKCFAWDHKMTQRYQMYTVYVGLGFPQIVQNDSPISGFSAC